MTDQFRADGIGDKSYTKTPNLDQLSGRGTSFSACYANAPVCIPSRFSLATGHSVSALGIANNIAVDLNPHQKYWTNLIKDEGYQTAVIGKTHLHRHFGDLREREHLVKAYGFDFIDEITGPRASMFVQSNLTELWRSKGYLQSYIEDYEERFANKAYVARPSVLPSELYADNYVGQSAVDYLNKVDTERPWFCWVSFGGPHEPWDAPQEYCSLYKDDDLAEPIPFDQGEVGALPKNSLHYQKHKEAPKLSAQEIRDLRLNYAANISLIDDRIGDILKVLERRQCLRNTIIIFTSDHGEMNGDHGLIYKNVFYEQAVKVPLVIVPPAYMNSLAPKKSDALVQLSDLGPTILELVGIENNIFDECYAKSFTRIWTKKSNKHRNYVFSELTEGLMVSDGRWKLVVTQNKEPYILYDLKNDPDEKSNRISRKRYCLVRRRLLKKAVSHINFQNDIRLKRNC